MSYENKMGGKTVLIVDDSPTERLILKKMMKKMGFETIEASSGADGVEVAKKNSEGFKIDLVLMDVIMGSGINGFQAANLIISDENSKNIPVIMCTTKSEEGDRLWGLKKGAKGYVTKPVSEEMLVAEIERLL